MGYIVTSNNDVQTTCGGCCAYEVEGKKDIEKAVSEVVRDFNRALKKVGSKKRLAFS